MPDVGSDIELDVGPDVGPKYKAYIGHIWAIHKLYISHVQPTVQATDGPYPISRKWGAAAKPPPPIFFIFIMVHLWLVL